MVCAKAETFHETSSLRSNLLKNAPQGFVITGGFITPSRVPDFGRNRLTDQR